jgi:hypothetical protein
VAAAFARAMTEPDAALAVRAQRLRRNADAATSRLRIAFGGA